MKQLTDAQLFIKFPFSGIPNTRQKFYRFPPVHTVTSQLNTVHNFIHYFSKIHFDILLPSMPKSPCVLFIWVLWPKSCTDFSIPAYVLSGSLSIVKQSKSLKCCQTDSAVRPKNVCIINIKLSRLSSSPFLWNIPKLFHVQKLWQACNATHTLIPWSTTLRESRYSELSVTLKQTGERFNSWILSTHTCHLQCNKNCVSSWHFSSPFISISQDRHSLDALSSYIVNKEKLFFPMLW